MPDGGSDVEDIVIMSVPHHAVADAWLDIIRHVRRLIPETHGRASEMSIFEQLLRQETFLFVAVKGGEQRGVIGFAIWRIADYPNGTRVLAIDYCAGDELRLWKVQMLSELERVAEANDCKKVEISGRAGWVRELREQGYEQVFVTVEKVLK